MSALFLVHFCVIRSMKKLNYSVDEVEKLAVRAREGDTAAFALLYDFFADPIYRYVYYRVSHDDALDLTETVFLKVWENIRSYRSGISGSGFSSWIYRIAHNVVVDSYRTDKKYGELSHDIPDENMVSNPASITEERLGNENLRVAIRKLKKSYQQVIVLKYINEMENHEIGRIMRKSEGSLRILKHRALKALKKVLESMQIKY